MTACPPPPASNHPAAAVPLPEPEGLPRKYLVLDTQTSGLESDDLILCIDHMLVEEGNVVDVGRELLNWLDEPYRCAKWLPARLAQSRRFHNIGPEELQSGGADPRVVLAAYRDVLASLRKDTLLVGHAIFAFDLQRLDRQIRQWVGRPGLGRDLPLFDLAVVQRTMDHDIARRPDETAFEFHKRVEGMSFPGGRWSLDYCVRQNQANVEVARDHPLYHLYAARAIYEALHRQLLEAPAG